MKQTLISHMFAAAAFTLLLASPLIAEQNDTPAPPSVKEINAGKASPQKLQIRTETIYETSFLPGVRLCEENEVDYRGEFRKGNCQDEALIDAVSTRKPDPYNLRPHNIVDDRIDPNGNVFRINFRRKASVVEPTADQ